MDEPPTEAVRAASKISDLLPSPFTPLGFEKAAEIIQSAIDSGSQTDEQIRDWLAGMALTGWAAGRNNGETSWNRSEGSSEPSFVAESCYRYADALMTERKKRQQKTDPETQDQPPMQPS